MDDWNGGPQNLVTLAVNVPDLNPYSEETMACFTVKDILRQPGCDPFAFEIVSRASLSANRTSVRSLFHSHKPLKGPYGYEKIETGPTDARFEYYRKIEGGRTLLYACQIFANEGKRDGICEALGNRATGPALHYSCELGHLKDIDQIDASLHDLVESFTLKTGQSKLLKQD